jgi:ubiquinone/menaquinone biosynthesis C-methylase UbiE
MTSTEVAEYWEMNAESWTQQARAGYDVYRDMLNTPAFLAILPDINGLKGLDIGCGEGENTRRLAGLGAKMSAFDVAPTFIRYAQQSERQTPLGIAYQVADATAALPFDDAEFDFATAFMSLMDMPNQQAVLNEVHRILKPGGFF